jgi:3-oxoacyl-[acyl-carrier protein] reductase
MLRKSKNIAVYEGGRQIGGASSRAFRREATTRLLVGRTQASPAAGGTTETAQIVAPDDRAVEKHADALVRKARRIDIRFNTKSTRGGQWRDTW